MSAPNVEVWALPATGSPVCLTDLQDFELSRVDGEVGSISLDYPAGGEGWDLLHQLRLPYRRLRVEIRTDGTSATARHALLTDAKGDATKPGSTWTLTGLYLGLRMSHARCPYADDGPNGDTVISGTPGVIVRTLMVRAQARGALVDVDFSSFSNTVDSNGQPWALEATLTFSPGRDYGSILQEMQTKLGMHQWEMRSGPEGDELRLYNPDTRGVDRSLPGQQVTLEYGRDFTDGPVTSSNRDVGTDVLGVGVNGMYQQIQNSAALALLGERIEVYADFGSVYDEGTLTELTTAAAEQAGVGARSFSHELVLGEDSPIPGVDYDLGDYILRAINGVAERVKVSQIVLRRQSGDLRCSVTLGDLLAEQEVKTRRLVENLANGSAIVGTSTLDPAIDDGKAPAAPTSVTVNSAAYYDGGTPLAKLSASWPGVTTNTDATALDDLSGYQVEFKYEAGQDLPSDWQVAGITAGTSLTWSPVVQAKIVKVRVLAYDKFNHNGPYSPEQTYTTAQDADAPPTPSTPQAASYLGILTAFSDGLGSSGQPQPDDFREFEIHISTTGPLFAPDRPGGGLALSTTYVGSLAGSGTFPIAVGDYGVTYYVKLVAVDKTGNASAASSAGSAVLVQAADGDVAGLSIGKLTAGIMSALMTISGIIQTAASGARVVIDSTGIRCYAADGTTLLFQYSIPSSLLTMVGKLTSGLGVGAGATIVVDPGPPPRIRLYPNATAQNLSIRADSTLRPDGTTGAAVTMESLNASNQTSGFSLWAWATNLWVGHKTTAGAWQGGRLILEQLGIVRLGQANDTGYVQIDNDGTARLRGGSGEVRIEADGDVRLVPASGKEVTSTVPVGTLGAGMSFHAQDGSAGGYRFVAAGGFLRFVENSSNTYLQDDRGVGAIKCFVIDHPTDSSRWLVHACPEAPEALVQYRGAVEIVDGQAVVDLPPYFEDATRPDGRTVHLTMQLPDEPLAAELPDVTPAVPPGTPWVSGPPVAAPAVPEAALLHPAAASTPQDGRFRISCPAPDGTRVAWLVHAIRSDVDPFDPEPLRRDVDVSGIGPYRTFTRRGTAA